jgi:hypothetical protein
MRSPNLLLIGPDVAARKYLEPIMSSLASPVVGIDGDHPAVPTGQVGTLIVWNVWRLTRPHQHELLTWLNAREGHTRIIALSARSLFPDVRRGAFSEDLYYRLNTVMVVLPHRQQVAAALRRNVSAATRLDRVG